MSYGVERTQSSEKIATQAAKLCFHRYNIDFRKGIALPSKQLLVQSQQKKQWKNVVTHLFSLTD